MYFCMKNLKILRLCNIKVVSLPCQIIITRLLAKPQKFSKMATQKEINNVIKRLCDLTGEYNNREAAIKAGKRFFIAYEDAPIYGGCRLIGVLCEGGGHLGVYNLSSTSKRIPKAQFIEMLWVLIAGIEYGISNAQKLSK